MLTLLISSALGALIGYAIADCRGLRQRIEILEAAAEKLRRAL